jgi:hypothetical protein
VNIVVSFIKGIADNLPKVIQSAFDLILAFVNGLSDGIDKNSGPLGDAAGRLAVAIIEGLVNGLKHGTGKVLSAAKDLAESALSGVGNWLGIHSPSREFYKLGAWSAEGLANGLSETASMVEDASKKVADKALIAMSKTISGLSDAVQGNVDINPTITPVLDLSDVKKKSSQIGSMLSVGPMNVDASYANAKIVSAGYSDNQAASQPVAPAPQETKAITFVQNNTSPKALSSADIYRQTKNQLSVARGVLVYQSGGA